MLSAIFAIFAVPSLWAADRVIAAVFEIPEELRHVVERDRAELRGQRVADVEQRSLAIGEVARLHRVVATERRLRLPQCSACALASPAVIERLRRRPRPPFRNQ